MFSFASSKLIILRVLTKFLYNIKLLCVQKNLLFAQNFRSHTELWHKCNAVCEWHCPLHTYCISYVHPEDLSNSLYLGLSPKKLSRLQMVQNTAARLVTNTRRLDHISPVLASLHWLLVNLRIDFTNLLIFVRFF